TLFEWLAPECIDAIVIELRPELTSPDDSRYAVAGEGLRLMCTTIAAHQRAPSGQRVQPTIRQIEVLGVAPHHVQLAASLGVAVLDEQRRLRLELVVAPRMRDPVGHHAHELMDPLSE